MMPGSLNGLDLAREVRRRRPDVGVLVTSGHYREMDGDIPGCDVFIPKPYEPRIVISRIGGLIDPDIEEEKALFRLRPADIRICFRQAPFECRSRKDTSNYMNLVWFLN